MRRWVALPLAVLVFLGPVVPGRSLLAQPAAATPRLERLPDHWRLTALPSILGDEEVEPELTSGLTASFVVQLAGRDRLGGKIAGGARIQVRYELWDEVFHAATLDVTGRVERQTLATFEDLAEWWRSLRLNVLRPPPELAPGTKLRVTVDLVPFSRREQDDAQRWFSDSLEHSGRSNAEELAQSADESPGRLSQVLNLLMATSIRRRATTSYSWDIEPTAPTVRESSGPPKVDG